MSYTLGQAAKATGKSKTTVQRAIKTGKISAEKDDFGRYRIDPAELHRVFTPVSDDEPEEQGETGERTGEIALLREQMAKNEALIEFLKNQLAESEKERRDTQEKFTTLLTHHRKKGLLDRFFGK